jgi:hypothetical protein
MAPETVRPTAVTITMLLTRRSSKRAQREQRSAELATIGATPESASSLPAVPSACP